MCIRDRHHTAPCATTGHRQGSCLIGSARPLSHAPRNVWSSPGCFLNFWAILQWILLHRSTLAYDYGNYCSLINRQVAGQPQLQHRCVAAWASMSGYCSPGVLAGMRTAQSRASVHNVLCECTQCYTRTASAVLISGVGAFASNSQWMATAPTTAST